MIKVKTYHLFTFDEEKVRNIKNSEPEEDFILEMTNAQFLEFLFYFGGNENLKDICEDCESEVEKIWTENS